MDVAVVIGNILTTYLINGFNVTTGDFNADDFNDTDFYIETTTHINGTYPTVIIKYDEFDPKSPSLQILLENLPIRATWIAGGMYKMEHRVRITLYQKLIHYRPNDVETYRSNWYGIKQEIDRILIKNKFSLPNINNTLIGSWADKIPTIAVGKGTKTTKEPIIWQSVETITCIYYENQELIIK